MERRADMIGWSHTPFGRLTGETVESLVTTVARDAIAHAGLAPADVDEIVLGHYNGGLSPLTFSSSLVLQADDDLRFTPATRVENACATGSAAVLQGVRAIAAGDARTVLVVGVEKMTDGDPRTAGRALLGADYDRAGSDSPVGFAEIFARIAEAYFARYGDHGTVLAEIAAKNHRHGVHNPFAQLRKDLGVEFCDTVSDRNPVVAGPLRRTDCSPISDGAAALVLTRAGAAPAEAPAVAVRAIAQRNDYLPLSRRDPVVFEAGRRAWQSALATAGATVWDLDLLEIHDCFTIAELIEYEMLGLCAPGEGRVVVEEGWAHRDGKLPVNPSGGLKSKGHPIGATGVSQHVLAAMQLTGAAGAMQVPDATRAGVFNMGGTAVANYASILERLR
ncbi:acetyl-CoA acetyltransferase [Nocardioides sp. WL0053]|uniref:Acetyl-CoA acetyltransferase n=1 Tax=Nocardioides jiangsuensis TaxID=2866161 RepID=A0ABS7RHV5_9ACTN|nr:acetyl-CoA acetyltransferase [Nocardioides jiangsuensis]MBY9074630.1 acetyl-CoA acetyltransferase [Nocardioides jiangsuensis]